MNKILVFIQIQNKSSSGSPLENLDSILLLRRLRTCYKQKRGRANFLIDRKIKNKLTDKEEELIGHKSHTSSTTSRRLKIRSTCAFFITGK